MGIITDRLHSVRKACLNSPSLPLHSCFVLREAIKGHVDVEAQGTWLTYVLPQKQSSVTQPTNRGRNLEKQTYQILKFRETSPASEPFARTGFGPSTNRKERMIAYISSFDSVYTRGKAAGSCS